MENDFQHKVLIVDNDDSTGKNLKKRLKKENIEPVFADSADSAFKTMKKVPFKFSVIVSAQHLKKMTGAQFLEKAKPLSPLSSLFLMADHADIKTIIDAVNKGVIQRYIPKPLDADSFIPIIKHGIDLCEFLFESQKLMRLAKSQNTKLYELNCELMEQTKTHNRTNIKLDEEIGQVKNEIKSLSDQPPVRPTLLTEEISSYIKDGGSLKPENITELFEESIRVLHAHFTDLAYRNGFEMPGTQKSSEQISQIG